MEELTPQQPIETNDVLYVFAAEKMAAFTAALASLPPDEVGKYQTYNALLRRQLVFEQGDNRLYDTVPVFCLVTDFRAEHYQLKAASEAESLFYMPVQHDDKRLINEFFGLPTEWSAELQAYLQQIGKPA